MAVHCVAFNEYKVQKTFLKVKPTLEFITSPSFNISSPMLLPLSPISSTGKASIGRQFKSLVCK